MNKSELIYNSDERVCRLAIHDQQRVLTFKGAKRVHLITPDNAEIFAIVSCAKSFKTKNSTLDSLQRQEPATRVGQEYATWNYDSDDHQGQYDDKRCLCNGYTILEDTKSL